MTHAFAIVNRGGWELSEEELLTQTLLQQASQGSLAGVREALQRGADPDARRARLNPEPIREYEDDDSREVVNDYSLLGPTALMYAAESGSVDCVRALILCRASLTAIEEDRWNPLHFAASSGHKEVCRTLLSYRASCQMRSKQGKAPLHLALAAVEGDREGRTEFQELLRLEPLRL